MKTAINLRTQEEFDKLKESLKDKEIRIPSYINYGRFKKDTCINLKTLNFFDIGYCKNRGYEIITYQQFLERELGIEKKPEPENVIDKFAERLKDEYSKKLRHANVMFDVSEFKGKTISTDRFVNWAELLLKEAIEKIAEEMKKEMKE